MNSEKVSSGTPQLLHNNESDSRNVIVFVKGVSAPNLALHKHFRRVVKIGHLDNLFYW